jgi:NADPH:quinone reductase
MLGLLRAAAGAVGTALVDTATAAGMKFIAVTTGEKLSFSRSRGAVETIDYKRENVTDRVGAITDGAGVALALNPVSGDSVLEAPKPAYAPMSRRDERVTR